MQNFVPKEPIEARFVGHNAQRVLGEVMDELLDTGTINRDQKRKMLTTYLYRNADAWNAFIKLMDREGLVVNYDDLMNSNKYFFSLKKDKWKSLTEEEYNTLLEKL